jgi:hypothetical protein
VALEQNGGQHECQEKRRDRAQRFGQGSGEARRQDAEPEEARRRHDAGAAPHAKRFFTRKNRL